MPAKAGAWGEPGGGDRAWGVGGAGLRAGGNLDQDRAFASAACPLQLTLEGRPDGAKLAKTNRADQIWRVPCQEV